MSRNRDRIVVKRAEGGGWYWKLIASTGRVLASSEVYTKRVWALRMAERVGGGRVRVVEEDAA